MCEDDRKFAIFLSASVMLAGSQHGPSVTVDLATLKIRTAFAVEAATNLYNTVFGKPEGDKS